MVLSVKSYSLYLFLNVDIPPGQGEALGEPCDAKVRCFTYKFETRLNISFQNRRVRPSFCGSGFRVHRIFHYGGTVAIISVRRPILLQC